MDGFKRSVGEWIKITESRVDDLKEGVSLIYGALEEVKRTMEDRADGCTVIRKTDVDILGKLSLIGDDLDKITHTVESRNGVGVDEIIGLDELVEEFTREKEVTSQQRKGLPRKKKVSERGSEFDDVRLRQARKILDGFGCMGDFLEDDSKRKKSIVDRVENCVEDYLKVDAKYRNESMESGVTKKLVGSKHLGMMAIASDDGLLEYVFDEARDPSEVVVATNTFCLRRDEFMTLSPNRLINKKVVDVFIEMLTEEERKIQHNEALYWWIPTYLTRPVDDENYVMLEQSAWLKWVGNLAEVNRIFVPVKVKDHWMLAIIVVDERIVQLLCCGDASVLKDCIEIVHDLLEALDIVLKDDIVDVKPIGWSFTEFEVYPGQVAVNVDSYGMFVFKVMQAAIDGGILCEKGSVQEFSSRVALKILKCAVNKEQAVVACKALCRW